jgi:hypothetical protein
MAQEPGSWPPPGATADRMHELQAIIGSAESTAAQRESARKELSDLLKSPAGQSRPTPDEKPVVPRRAAIEPFGQIVKPATTVTVPMPGVATVEVVTPPRITISPPTGRPVVPSIGSAVDPRTGHILHETPNGFIDPRTGQFTPK